MGDRALRCPHHPGAIRGPCVWEDIEEGYGDGDDDNDDEDYDVQG